MSSLLYYMPGATAPVPNLIDAWRDDALPAYRQVAAGPDEKPGVVCAWEPEGRDAQATEPGYYPDAQTWREHHSGRYWIGWPTDARPTPADLIRRDAVAGHPVTLTDGHPWLVPIARCPDGSTQLPQIMTETADGLANRPHPRYLALSDLAGAFFDFWQADLTHGAAVEAGDSDPPSKPEPFSDPQFWRLACLALSANYRVSGAELSALELVDTRSLCQIGLAAIDWPSVLAMEEDADPKKDDGPDVAS